MSNEFYYNKAMSMKETSRCTYQATLPLAYGEEFDFTCIRLLLILQMKILLPTSVAPRRAMGMSRQKITAPLSETAAQKSFTSVISNREHLYNRVFDQVTLVYNWGGCEQRGHVEPEGCSAPTFAIDG